MDEAELEFCASLLKCLWAFFRIMETNFEVGGFSFHFMYQIFSNIVVVLYKVYGL